MMAVSSHWGLSLLSCLLWILSSTPLESVRLRSIMVSAPSGVCNATFSGSRADTRDSSATALHPPPVTPAMRGETRHCIYTFHGTQHQRVMIHVRELKLGQFDSLKNRCVHAYLRIWDGFSVAGSHIHPPNTLCGYKGAMELCKFSTGQHLVVEYRVDHARPYMDFTLQYKFINMKEDAQSYPDQLTHDMKATANTSSLCEWSIALEDCLNECQILSPGYPGMYPPNIECVYHIYSTSPHVRMQLNFHGQTAAEKMRTFNVRPSKHCRKDYLLVEDYPSNAGGEESRVIGKFCGDQSQDILTPGNAITLTFRSADEMAPFGYNGFHLSVLGVTKEWNPSGRHVASTLCDWEFTSHSGSVSTPDHWLPSNATCRYSFKLQQGYVLQLRLNVYGLGPDCGDQILIYQDKQLQHRLCDADLPPKDNDDDAIKLQVSSPRVKVIYQTRKGQFQGHSHRGFWLSFLQVPAEIQERQITVETKKDQSLQSPDASRDMSAGAALANQMSLGCLCGALLFIFWSHLYLVECLLSRVT